MKKEDIRNKIDQLSKNKVGPQPRLFEKTFYSQFVDAIFYCGVNGQKVHKHLQAKGISISYTQVQEYLRRIFGSYQTPGKPPKYLAAKRAFQKK